MDCGSGMHQQYLKNFIHSLQGGNHVSISLNPNAAEFVPSYLKSSADEERLPSGTSTTTLVHDDIVGDALHMSCLDAQSRIQRQLFNLMDQLGNHNAPLAVMQFSLTPDAQGINVQFLLPGGGTGRPRLDEHLCLASGLRVELTHQESNGQLLAAQFLNRVCAVVNGKSQVKQPSICPRCTALPRKHSYTELEIERQIEDIKEFERLINDDVGTRYQEGFKELCHKLGLTTPEQQLQKSGMEIGTARPQSIEGDDWDAFTSEFNHVEQMPQPHPKVPHSTPAMSTTSTSVSTSAFPKLYKVGQPKAPTTNTRRTNLYKEERTPGKNGMSTATAAVPAAKKQLPEQLCVTGSRPKALRNQLPELCSSQLLKAKVEARSKPKHQLESGHVNKHPKAATLPRAIQGGMRQTPASKQSSAAARVLAPRSTHASQMRQSEVKRRLNLMRGEDNDVQFNEYLFK